MQHIPSTYGDEIKPRRKPTETELALDAELTKSWATTVAAEETAENAKKLLEGVQLTIHDFLAQIDRELDALNGGIR